MSQIKYQFGAIQAAAADINSTSARINGQLDDLKAQLQPMVSTWEGESSIAYQEAQARWDQAAAELNPFLATISLTGTAGHAARTDVNRSAAAAWSERLV